MAKFQGRTIRYGSQGASASVKFLEGPKWRKAIGSQKEVNTVNRNAVEAGALDFQAYALNLRFSKQFMAKAPFFVRVSDRLLFGRARRAYKDHRTVPGAPNLREFFRTRFGGWDPWSKSGPPLRMVKALNNYLLRNNQGGYRASWRDRWTRASADYRRWAKKATWRWIKGQVSKYGPMLWSGELARYIDTGKVKATATGKKSLATLSVPRRGRQNYTVGHVFGGSSGNAIITEPEIRRFAEVVAASIVAQVEGAATALPKKRGRKRKGAPRGR